MEDFNAPLGLDRNRAPAPSKFSPVRIMAGLIVLLVGFAAVWVMIIDTTDYSEPQKTVALGNNQTNTGKSIAPTPLRSTKQTDAKTLTSSDPKKPGRLDEMVAGGKLEKPRIRYVNQPRSSSNRLSISPERGLFEKTSTGSIPKISNSGRRPMDAYARDVPAGGSMQIAIVVGGFGLSQSGSKAAIEQLPPDVTLAFAPYGNSLRRWMEKARKDGHELLMQVPMEPIGYPEINPGKHTLITGAAAEENISSLHWSMGRMTNYVGMMNYLGAKMNADTEALRAPFADMARRGLLYLDDGSSFSSKAQAVAKETSLPFLRGNIIIDDGRSSQIIAKNLAALEKLARRNGKAVGIASAFPLSVKQISRWMNEAEKRGIEFVPVSALIR